MTTSARRPWMPLALALGAALLGCDEDRAVSSYGGEGVALHLRGAGATVPRALFARWAREYANVDPKVTLDYDPTGSGAGVRAVLADSVEIGVSDTPLSDDDARAHGDIRHVPLAVEAIAVVYALKDVPDGASLKMTPEVLADLLQSRRAFWDDPDIAALNAPVKLPHVPVRVVYRSDESGSSQLLTDWLSRTTPRWSRGAGRSLALPNGVGAQKDDGMIAQMRATDGSLGYVSAVTARAEHLASLALRNAAGRFVGPSLEGMRAAATAAQLGDDLRARATAAPGDLAYPLCSFTFSLVRADGPDVDRRRALARFLWWATHDGQRFAPPLGFGALPGELAARDEAVLRALSAAGTPVLDL